MASNRFVYGGLEELKAELRAMPAELTAEGSHIVEGAANGAAVAIRTIYGGHVVTGHLQRDVVVEHQAAGQFGAMSIVKANGRIAWLFENGSEARHYVTVRGNRRETGRMPPAHVFIPTMIRARAEMYRQLADLMRRHGLVVTGQAA